MALFWEMLAVQLDISQVNQTVSQKSRLWTPKWSILNFKYIFVVIIYHFRGLRVSDFDTLLMVFFISLLQNNSHHWVFLWVYIHICKRREREELRAHMVCIFKSPRSSTFVYECLHIFLSQKKRKKKHAMWSQKHSS